MELENDGKPLLDERILDANQEDLDEDFGSLYYLFGDIENKTETVQQLEPQVPKKRRKGKKKGKPIVTKVLRDCQYCDRKQMSKKWFRKHINT